MKPAEAAQVLKVVLPRPAEEKPWGGKWRSQSVNFSIRLEFIFMFLVFSPALKWQKPS